MSYCRWSTDGSRCDVYTYEGTNGFEVHVAAYRRQVPDTLVHPFEITGHWDHMSPEDLVKLHAEYHRTLELFPLIKIESPSAGATFHEPDLHAFRERMLELQNEGIRFPDEVLLMIDEEIASEQEKYVDN
jgi:hypothetical protein